MPKTFPSPLAGEGGECSAQAMHEPDEGFLKTRFARALTRFTR
jgi:hypothetical protein